LLFLHFPRSGTLFALAEAKLTLQGITMLFSMTKRDRLSLSRRSRTFIRIHHVAVFALIAWIGYLFTLRELL